MFVIALGTFGKGCSIHVHILSSLPQQFPLHMLAYTTDHLKACVFLIKSLEFGSLPLLPKNLFQRILRESVTKKCKYNVLPLCKKYVAL